MRERRGYPRVVVVVVVVVVDDCGQTWIAVCTGFQASTGSAIDHKLVLVLSLDAIQDLDLQNTDVAAPIISESSNLPLLLSSSWSFNHHIYLD